MVAPRNNVIIPYADDALGRRRAAGITSQRRREDPARRRPRLVGSSAESAKSTWNIAAGDRAPGGRE